MIKSLAPINRDSKSHVFEAAGLGLAPFTFSHCTHGQTQCDFCGTHIANVFWVKSADDKCFKVGCDCIEKTYDRGLIERSLAEKRKMERAKRKAREAAVQFELNTIAGDRVAMEELLTIPHPMGWTNRIYRRDAVGNYVRNENGDTILDVVPMNGQDYFLWMKRNAGNAGLAKLLKWYKTTMKK